MRQARNRIAVSLCRLFAFVSCLAFINACSWMPAFSGGPYYGKTLADLKAPEIPDDPRPVTTTSLGQIEDSYRAALEVATDPSVRHRILIRLADLEMVRSEDRQVTAEEQGQFFDDAVDMYQELITLNKLRENEPGNPSNERLLYQLSKAYALDGNLEESNRILSRLVQEFPESQFAAEAEFRRAEQAFAAKNYVLSEKLYTEVMQAGKDTPFYSNAVYMQGWSRFKQNQYRKSVDSFTEVLDKILVKGRDLSKASNSERNLISDTLRVMSIAFSYLDGANSITEIYGTTSPRHYQYQLYLNLGDLYLEKERYRDSADTYRHFVQKFPNTEHSPKFSEKAIEVYKQGNFPSLIIPAKEEYVTNYGIYSAFWKERSDEQRKQYMPKLYLYIDELSSHYHATAIEQAKYRQDFLAGKIKSTAKKKAQKPENPAPNFLKAASLYKQFTETFPKDKKTPEMTFLMGEAYFEARALPSAVEAYEVVAYKYLDKKRGAEAGHSAVIALDMLVQKTTGAAQQEWKKKKITSAINFADHYPGDKRAIALLTKATQELFEQGQLAKASEMATRITQWQPVPDRKILKTVWLIIAHSHFDLKRYTQAEVAYKKTLSFLDPKDPDRAKIVERIAASAYKSAEELVAAGDKVQAVERLLAIKNVSPGSAVAQTAHYDAANYLLELKQWNRAEKELLDFKARYPQHKLTPTIAAKLALVYQETKQWAKAAAVIAEMARSDSNPAVRRQSLYLSAELYEKSGKTNQAITKYGEYVKKYPQPFDLSTEARFRLVELHKKRKDTGKQNFWLRKLMEADRKAGSKRTDRSKYLAAMASAKFANDEYRRFQAIKLTLPIKKSLKRKKSALDKTLKSYKGVLNYGVAEFSTEANHRIGMIYAQLSKDLMNSQRPKGLDALALEQYEILLEEQAYPFEEKAIDIHSANAERAWGGIYDKWVKRSFTVLAKLLPGRYDKQESKIGVSNGLH